MKQIFDFLYYFMYQLNRRGYKKFNYENARVGVTTVIFPFFLSLTDILSPIVRHFILVDLSNDIWIAMSILASIILTFYFTGKFYGPDGSRTWVVKYYDKNTNIRKQNSVLQSIVLAMLIVGLVAVGRIINFRLYEYLTKNY